MKITFPSGALPPRHLLHQHQGLLYDQKQFCLYFSLPWRKNKGLDGFINPKDKLFVKIV
jgi:hypothetical protein